MESKVRILLGLAVLCCIPGQLHGATVHHFRLRRDVTKAPILTAPVTKFPASKEHKNVKESSLDIINDTTDLKKSKDIALANDSAESKLNKVFSEKTKNERNKKLTTNATTDKQSSNKSNSNISSENVTDSYKETGRSLDFDIEKYTSPEFQNKNNVYIFPTSPEIAKYLDPDSQEFFPTKLTEQKQKPTHASSTIHNYNDALTTPPNELFDEKYKRVTDGIKQNIDDLDEKIKTLKEEEKGKYEIVKMKDGNKTPNENNVTLHIVEMKNIEMNASELNGKKQEDVVSESALQVNYEKTFLKTQTNSDKNITDAPSQNKIKLDESKHTINDSDPRPTTATNQKTSDSTDSTHTESFITSSRNPTAKNLALPETNNFTTQATTNIDNKEKVMYTPQSSSNYINVSKRGQTKFINTVGGTNTTPMNLDVTYDNKNFSLPPSATAWTLVGMRQTPVFNNTTATTETKIDKEQDVQENQLFKTIIPSFTKKLEGSTEGLSSSLSTSEATSSSSPNFSTSERLPDNISTESKTFNQTLSLPLVTSPEISTTEAETKYNTHEMLSTDDTSTNSNTDGRTMEISTNPTETIENSVSNMKYITTEKLQLTTIVSGNTTRDSTPQSTLNTEETLENTTMDSSTTKSNESSPEVLTSTSTSLVTSVSISTSQKLPLSTTESFTPKDNYTTTETDDTSTEIASLKDLDTTTSLPESTETIFYNISEQENDSTTLNIIPKTSTFITTPKQITTEDEGFDVTEDSNDYDGHVGQEGKTHDKEIDVTHTNPIETTEKQKDFFKTTAQIPVVIDREIATKISESENTTTDSTSSTELLAHDGHDDDDSHPGIVAAIAISAVAAVCLVVLAGLLLIMRKRQKKMSYGQRCRPVSLDAYSLDNVSVYNSVRRKGGIRASKRSYGNPAFEDPVSISNQMNFQVLAKFSDNNEAIDTEYEDIPMVTARANEVPPGCEIKNRYANVIPLPETRVFLKSSDSDPSSDYINANYVTGPKNVRGYYIACQAPLQNTVDDFWRMIWEQQCRVILMLTNLYENGVEKCVDYLPPSEVLDCHRLFGDFQITLKKREVKEKYIISSLQLKNMVSNSWREVTHLWYLGWPERGVPQEANSLIAFLIEARSHLKAASNNNTSEAKMEETANVHISGKSAVEGGPVVVHCSPGTGRTGTVIACDIAIRDFELTRSVDIPKIVYRVRRDRASAVQTKEQYSFIYKVITLYATKLTGGALDSI